MPSSCFRLLNRALLLAFDIVGPANRLPQNVRPIYPLLRRRFFEELRLLVRVFMILRVFHSFALNRGAAMPAVHAYSRVMRILQTWHGALPRFSCCFLSFVHRTYDGVHN